jgi:hypothetical protein
MSAGESIRRRQEADKKRTNRFAALLAAGVVSVVGAVELTNLATAPPGRTVVETVQPGDTPGMIATRAESQFGTEPAGASVGEFDVHAEAMRLVEKYGTPIRPGEQLEVHVR